MPDADQRQFENAHSMLLDYCIRRLEWAAQPDDDGRIRSLPAQELKEIRQFLNDNHISLTVSTDAVTGRTSFKKTSTLPFPVASTGG